VPEERIALYFFFVFFSAFSRRSFFSSTRRRKAKALSSPLSFFLLFREMKLREILTSFLLSSSFSQYLQGFSPS